MFNFPFGEPVERRRYEPTGETDRYGHDITEPVVSTLDQLAAFDPGDSTEPTETDRHSVIVKPSLYFTEAPDVLATDELKVRDEWFQVVGSPRIYRSPFDGVTGGVVVELRKVDG